MYGLVGLMVSFNPLRARAWASFLRHSAQTLALRLGLLLALAVVIWPALVHASEVWSTDEEFTYGFLIPPVALLIVWWQRDALRRSVGMGHTSGLAIVVGAI